MSFNRLLQFGFILQVIFIIGFLYFCYQSNIAIDKNGFGSAAEFSEYNKYAGYSFYTSVLLWLSAIFVSTFAKKLGSRISQITIGLPPVLMVMGWVILWLL